MIKRLQNSIQKLKVNPKRLFVIDGIGAVLSAFLLGIVLVRLESIFGIPSSALFVLAIIPIFFLLFDVISYYSKAEKTSSLLKVIAVLNTLYCIFSIAMAINHMDSITWLGWVYLILEIIVVLSLVMIELGVSKELKRQ